MDMEKSKGRKRVLRDTTYLEEASAVAVGTGLGAYIFSSLSFLPDLREALYNVRHAGRTVEEMVLGGPGGMRAAKNLEEAISIVESARQTNSEATGTLESYLIAREGLVRQLVSVYKENETFGREAERLGLQIQGAMKATFELGNSIKPDFMTDIDNLIIKIYGKDVVKAREESAQVRKFYEGARKFHDAREKGEHVVEEFCKFLKDVKVESEEANERLNELFPGIISQVKEGYETEDIVFAQHRSKDFSELRNTETGEKITGFRKYVDSNYTAVGNEIPIREYSEKNWVDFATNPVGLGVAAALMGYAVSKLVLPKILRDPITKLIASPVTLPLRGVRFAGKRVIDKLKKQGRAGNITKNDK